MAPTKRQGKQPAKSNSHNVRDKAARAQPYDYHGLNDEDDHPKLNPGIVERYGALGIKHTRQFIRPVMPNSFSPQRVEEYIKVIMMNTYPKGCKGLEYVDWKTFVEWFEYFMFNTKWMPEDDASIRECFRNKCVEIMQKYLQFPARKSKQHSNVQSSRDAALAGNSKHKPNIPSHKDVNPRENYLAPYPVVRGEASESKKGKRPMLDEDQSMDDDDEDLSDGEFSNLLDEIHRSGYQIDVDALLAEVKNSFDITDPGLIQDKDAQTSIFVEKCEGREVIIPAPTSSRRNAVPGERRAVHPRSVRFATPLTKSTNEEASAENDVALPSTVRNVVKKDQEH